MKFIIFFMAVFAILGMTTAIRIEKDDIKGWVASTKSVAECWGGYDPDCAERVKID